MSRRQHRLVGISTATQARLFRGRAAGVGEVRDDAKLERSVRLFQARRDGEARFRSAGGGDVRWRLLGLLSCSQRSIGRALHRAYGAAASYLLASIIHVVNSPG